MTTKPQPPTTHRRIIVRRPSPRLAEGQVSHIPRRPVDPDLALGQWEAYVDAFRSAGWDVIELPRRDEHPDGVFVEDIAFVYGNLGLVARPGAESRRGEIDGLERHLRAAGLDVVHIHAPGTLEGGDLLKIGTTIYAGRSARTNAAGLAQLRDHVEPRGATVVEVPVTAALHLKSCVTAIPDGTPVGYPPLVEDPSVFPGLIPVPEESGAHVVDLGEGRILVAAGCPVTAARFAQLSYQVVAVDIGQFERVEGCVTCLSIRLHAGID